MIDQHTSELAQGFSAFWNEIFERHHRLQLDFSWPSIGVLDQLLYPLRGKEKLNEVETELIRGSAAYLAKCTEDIWRNFEDDIKVEVKSHQGTRSEITIEAGGGLFLEKEKTFKVPLIKTLTQLLRSPPQPFSTLGSATRRRHSESNILSPFCTGLFCGICSYGQGAWREKSIEEFAPYLHQTALHLSNSTAEWYRVVHPTTQTALSSEFYYNLVLPPLEYDEPYPAIRAASTLLNNLKLDNLSLEDAKRTALNLAQNPDDALSTAGWLTLAAYAESSDEEKLRALAFAHGPGTCELRPAFMKTRHLLEKEPHWVDLMYADKPGEAAELFRFECSVRFLPGAFCPSSLLENKHLRECFNMLAWSQYGQARDLFEVYCALHDAEAPVLLQLSYLDLILGDLDKAQEICKRAERTAKDPESEFYLSALKGSLASSSGAYEEATAFFKKALSFESMAKTIEFEDAASSLASLLLAKRSFQEVLDLGQGLFAAAVPLRISRVIALKALGHLEESREELLKLFELVPNSAKVVNLLKTELLLDKAKQENSSEQEES